MFETEKPQEETPVMLPLSRRRTLVELGAASTESDSPESTSGLSSTSTVIITESELSSSWLYKNRKDATATPIKEDPLNENAILPDEPTVLEAPEMTPVPVPTKPRPEKCSSRCCYLTVVVIICLCTLGILSIIGSVVYMEIFSAYKYMEELPVADKPLRTLPRQQDRQPSVMIETTPEVKSSFRAMPEPTEDHSEKPSPSSFMGDLSSRLTATLQSEGIIDQTSTRLTEDLNQLKDRLLVSAEETWNASQNLVSNIALLFGRERNPSSSDDFRSNGTELQPLSEPSDVFQRFVGGFLGPSFNFAPFGIRREEKTEVITNEPDVLSEFQDFPSFPAAPEVSNLVAHTDATTFEPLKSTVENNTWFSGENSSFYNSKETTAEAIPTLSTGDPKENTLVRMERIPKLEHIESAVSEALQQDKPTKENIEAKTAEEAASESSSNTEEFYLKILGEDTMQADATSEELVTKISKKESLAEAKSKEFVESSTARTLEPQMNNPIRSANVVPVEFLKQFQILTDTVSTEKPRKPVDLKMSLAEAMKHLLALDVNKTFPSSRSKPTVSKPKPLPLGTKRVGPMQRPHKNETRQDVLKSERKGYLQRLRTIMFGGS